MPTGRAVRRSIDRASSHRHHILCGTQTTRHPKFHFQRFIYQFYSLRQLSRLVIFSACSPAALGPTSAAAARHSIRALSCLSDSFRVSKHSVHSNLIQITRGPASVRYATIGLGPQVFRCRSRFRLSVRCLPVRIAKE